MSWTLCTSGAALFRAGANVSSVMTADVPESFSIEAEGLIEAETGMSIVDNFAGYVLSGAASAACAAKVAMMCISYNTNVYRSREADTLMNNNDFDYKLAIKNMKDFKKTTLNNPN